MTEASVPLGLDTSSTPHQQGHSIGGTGTAIKQHHHRHGDRHGNAQTGRTLYQRAWLE